MAIGTDCIRLFYPNRDAKLPDSRIFHVKTRRSSRYLFIRDWRKLNVRLNQPKPLYRGILVGAVEVEAEPCNSLRFNQFSGSGKLIHKRPHHWRFLLFFLACSTDNPETLVGVPK